jgi:streptomycin 6-kinase
MTQEEILLELDKRHRALQIALSKDKPSLYSEAAKLIRELLEQVKRSG